MGGRSDFQSITAWRLRFVDLVHDTDGVGEFSSMELKWDMSHTQIDELKSNLKLARDAREEASMQAEATSRRLIELETTHVG